MTKHEYLYSLEEIVFDEIFIVTDTHFLDKEISTNCWSISANQESIDNITVEDLSNLFSRVKKNRVLQLNKTDLEIDLIFYSWFDEQACQLRFNLINSNHKSLPFRAKIHFVENQNEIIENYLNSKYHEGIPWQELSDVQKGSSDCDADMDENAHVVKVYKEVLKHHEN